MQTSIYVAYYDFGISLSGRQFVWNYWSNKFQHLVAPPFSYSWTTPDVDYEAKEISCRRSKNALLGVDDAYSEYKAFATAKYTKFNTSRK